LRSRRARASCRSPRATCTRALHARAELPGWAPSMMKKRRWKPSGQRPDRASGLPSARSEHAENGNSNLALTGKVFKRTEVSLC
jgi:hypothetical protein